MPNIRPQTGRSTRNLPNQTGKRLCLNRSTTYQTPDPRVLANALDLASDRLLSAREALDQVECAAVARVVDELVGEDTAAFLELRARRFLGVETTGIYRTTAGDARHLEGHQPALAELAALVGRLDDYDRGGWEPLCTYRGPRDIQDAVCDLDLAAARTLPHSGDIFRARERARRRLSEETAQAERLYCCTIAVAIEMQLTEYGVLPEFDAASVELEMRPSGEMQPTGVYRTAAGEVRQLTEKAIEGATEHILTEEGRAGWEPLCTRHLTEGGTMVYHLDLVAASALPPIADTVPA